jgi:hypothetical protein
VDQISCGEPHLYRTSLSGVRVIMMLMRVLMAESLCQAMTGQISTPECLSLGACGSQ